MKSRIPMAMLLVALFGALALAFVGVPHDMPLADLMTAVIPQASGLFLAAGPVALMERKSEGGGGDDDAGPGFKKIKDLIEKQGQAWHEFKAANDARLAALEKKGYAPAELVGKVDSINTDLNKLSAEIAEILKKAQRPGAGQGGAESKFTSEQLEHKDALSAYLRKGDDEGLHDLERKAMNTGSDPDGGFLVGVEMDREIDRVARAESSFRGLANVRTIGGASYKKMVKTRGISGGWVGEQEDSQEGQGARFEEIEIVPHRMYAEPWVTNDMLEDSEYDLEADLSDEAGITFGEIEGGAFLLGNGIKKARGLLAYPIVQNSNWSWGKVGVLKTGVDGDFAAANPGDVLITLQHALKQGYRNGASWLMADSTLGRVRQMKDGSGQYYLWNPDPASGFGGRLLGAVVNVDDFMPTLAADALGIAYGNFKRAYTIVDRRGIAVIRDSVTKKGTTKFHFSRRVGGGVTNFEAYKALQFKA
ncbi:UNVERIFIED_ORG: phage major capsid protein [Shinella sp. XGS7]|nr:phage major capsid protein [Shinella sp. XGS7]